METIIATLLILACGFTGLLASTRTFLIATTVTVALLCFGPVAYRYSETGDGSLIWEAVFRAAILAIIAWGVREYHKVKDVRTSNN